MVARPDATSPGRVSDVALRTTKISTARFLRTAIADASTRECAGRSQHRRQSLLDQPVRLWEGV